MKIVLLKFSLIFCSVILFSQPKQDCYEGTEKSEYGFINPCSSFINFDTSPKNIGQVFAFDLDILQNKTYCAYQGYPPNKDFFQGNIEWVEEIKFPIRNRKNMQINLTPCKVNRFYVKKNVDFRFENWENYLGEYSSAKWAIEKQGKTPSRADSIFVLKIKQPSFGDFLALLYLELDAKVDIDLPKLSEYLTGNKVVMREFYESYFHKEYDELNSAWYDNEEEKIEFTPNLIVQEYVPIAKGYDHFTPVALFFDRYYTKNQKYFFNENLKDLITKIYHYFMPDSNYFEPEYLLDKYHGALHLILGKESIALEINNSKIQDLNNRQLPLSFQIEADINYLNLPYERISLEKSQEISATDFYLGNGFLYVEPESFQIDLDLYQNSSYLGFISTFHQRHDKSDFPFKLDSDEYIQSFMGLFITDAIISLKLGNLFFQFENARLIIDGEEINGTFTIDFSKFDTPMDEFEVIRQFKLNGIEAEIPERYGETAQIFFQIKN